jgi:uncharacterized protein YecT (DUF1311 family)
VVHHRLFCFYFRFYFYNPRKKGKGVHMKKSLVALMCCALVAPLAAHAGCAKPRGAFDQVYCNSTQFSQADRDLNNEYNRLRKQLNGAQQAALKSGQLAWMKTRDVQCSYAHNDGYYIDLQCANNMTQARLSFLRARERECSSTGCVSSMLGQ